MNQKRLNRVIKALFKDLVYCIHSNGNQGFFSLKNGKYQLITRQNFEVFKTTPLKWLYTHYALLTINNEPIVKADASCLRCHPMSLVEHYSYTPKEVKEWVGKQNANHVRGTLSTAALQDSIEPSNEVISSIIKFLETHKGRRT